MMRSALAASLCCVAFVGCMQVPLTSAPTAEPFYDDYTVPPLQLRLWGPTSRSFATGATGGFSFHVNRPAHVAMFAVIPGAGVRVLYPSFGRTSYLVEGYHHPFLSGGSGWTYGPGAYGRSAFDPFGYAPWGYHDLRYGYGYGHAYQQGPTYVFAIASEYPIAVDELRYRGAYARGYHLASFSPWATMDVLVDMLLPGVPSSSYATDFVIIWPDPPARRTTHIAYMPSRGDTLVIGDSIPADAAACPDGAILGRSGALARGARRLCTTDEETTTATSEAIRGWRQAERSLRPTDTEEARARIIERSRERAASGEREAESREGVRGERPDLRSGGDSRQAERRARPADQSSPRARPRAAGHPAPTPREARPAPAAERPSPAPAAERPSPAPASTPSETRRAPRAASPDPAPTPREARPTPPAQRPAPAAERPTKPAEPASRSAAAAKPAPQPAAQPSPRAERESLRRPPDSESER